MVVLLREREVRWHRLVGEDYQEMPVNPEGVIRSIVFPGLWLHVATLLEGHVRQVLKTLEEGLASPDHAEFVEHLAAR